MEPSEILREEHVVIEHLLQVLDGLAEHVDLGNSVPERDIDTALEAVGVRAGREEEMGT